MSTQTTRRRDQTDAAATGIAADTVRLWVTCYTGWVSAEAAERRREEIHSDLWEQQADARERGASPVTASLSIVRRAAVGAPADLLWVQTQRAASRGLPAEQKARSMNTATRLLLRWWWALGAAVLAAWIITMSTGQLLAPGMPYLAGTIQGYTMGFLLIGAVILRVRMPRTSAVLAVVGAVPIAVLLWWAPIAMGIAIVVLIGAAVEVVRLTRARARALAVLGIVAILVAPFGIAISGARPDLGALLWAIPAVGGVALLVVTGRDRIHASSGVARPA